MTALHAQAPVFEKVRDLTDEMRIVLEHESAGLALFQPAP
jgi:hypothetical protein